VFTGADSEVPCVTFRIKLAFYREKLLAPRPTPNLGGPLPIGSPRWLIQYEGVYKSFRTGGLELGPQTLQFCAIRCSCIAILSVSLVSFVAITLYVASQRM